MSMLPLLSTPTGTMVMPAITAEAGLVPCAEIGMMQTLSQDTHNQLGLTTHPYVWCLGTPLPLSLPRQNHLYIP